MLNKKVLIGLGVLVTGVLIYKHIQKMNSNKVNGESMSNASGVAEIQKGVNCKCSNGFFGNCQSGDCAKCCGKMGYDKK